MHTADSYRNCQSSRQSSLRVQPTTLSICLFPYWHGSIGAESSCEWTVLLASSLPLSVCLSRFLISTEIAKCSNWLDICAGTDCTWRGTSCRLPFRFARRHERPVSMVMFDFLVRLNTHTTRCRNWLLPVLLLLFSIRVVNILLRLLFSALNFEYGIAFILRQVGNCKLPFCVMTICSESSSSSWMCGGLVCAGLCDTCA